MNTQTTTLPYIPENAPFSAEQRAWLNGLLAGMFSGTVQAGGQVESPALAVTILYGSQTGTAEGLCKKAAKALRAGNCSPEVLDMDAFDIAKLKDLKHLLIITSTYGEGEPPDNAVSFFEALHAEDAPQLEGLRYAVLGLGDSSYPDFCACSRRFDKRLEALGGKRLAPTVECDVDTDAGFQSWMQSLQEVLGKGAEAEEIAAETVLQWSKQNPFPAKLIRAENLNGSDGSKATWHVEISLEGSGIEYEVGDALGILPVNCPALVEDFLRLLGFDGEEAIELEPGAGVTSLRHALSYKLDIRGLNPAMIEAYLKLTEDPVLTELLQDRKALNDFMWGRELYDLIQRSPQPFRDLDTLKGFLKKLQPRLYSISSSMRAHPGEVHLTVGQVQYNSEGRERKGVCSNYLAERAQEGPVQVYLHVNKAFRLPDNNDAPVIMIGPGTGIAPFRAFLEEREARGAKGRNWLFFGDRNIATDFLYRDQLEGWLKSGHLSRLDTAFSRDQDERIYVQQRMLESAEEMYSWLESGACIYVCGDASRMAKDVDAALHQIISTASGCTPTEAEACVKNLKKEKRYLRDVY